MLTRPLLLVSAAAALALGGCRGTENRGLETVHQPVVERADYLLDLQTTGDALADGESARLAGWFDAMRLSYGDQVSVDDGGGGYGARAEVGGIVAGYGLLVADATPVNAAPVAPGTVRVVVGRRRASVPGCPDWSRDASLEIGSNTSSNYGCSVNGSLAAMIANPADLVRGRTGPAATDPLLSTKAIESYRKAPATGASGIKPEKAGAK
ncbi:CpaD family pilus assembly lipoprotein [uncultured Sphingomonas sp.]|uniref:CpaD family pilus assembly lipoprotein n=1 Tax=uncultured Sphingomonas sp. TaxID=158754 RepID=UPI0035CA23FE